MVGRVVPHSFLLKLRENAAPALVKADLHVGREVVAVVYARDHLVAVEHGLEVWIGVVRVPLRPRRAQALQEEKALRREGVERIDVNGVLFEDRAVVPAPRLVAVDRSVGMVRLELVVELVLLDQAVVVLVGSSGSGLLGSLLDLAGAQERDALVVGEAAVGREFVYELYLAHVSPLLCSALLCPPARRESRRGAPAAAASRPQTRSPRQAPRASTRRAD